MCSADEGYVVQLWEMSSAAVNALSHLAAAPSLTSADSHTHVQSHSDSQTHAHAQTNGIVGAEHAQPHAQPHAQKPTAAHLLAQLEKELFERAVESGDPLAVLQSPAAFPVLGTQTNGQTQTQTPATATAKSESVMDTSDDQHAPTHTLAQSQANGKDEKSLPASHAPAFAQSLSNGVGAHAQTQTNELLNAMFADLGLQPRDIHVLSRMPTYTQLADALLGYDDTHTPAFAEFAREAQRPAYQPKHIPPAGSSLTQGQCFFC